MLEKVFVIFLAFFQLSRAFSINCNFQTEGNGNYGCKVTGASGFNISSHISDVTGALLNGQTPDRVKTFQLLETPREITKIPQKIHNFFPNFTKFLCQSCAIEVLFADDLIEYPNLRHFEMVHTKITEIPANFFTANHQLTVVDFSYNEIEIIGENFLENFENLEKLDFTNNSCIDGIGESWEEIQFFLVVLEFACEDPEATTIETTSEFSTVEFNFTTISQNWTTTTTKSDFFSSTLSEDGTQKNDVTEPEEGEEDVVTEVATTTTERQEGATENTTKNGAKGNLAGILNFFGIFGAIILRRKFVTYF